MFVNGLFAPTETSMDLSFLPLVNALLNTAATVLLLLGRMQIKRGQVQAHQRMMISACVVSTLFLAFYLLHKIWKAQIGQDIHTEFHADGLLKLFYLLILFTHLILAMTVPVLAVILLVLGFRRHDQTHRRIARVAWPIWMYVSLTGVLIYLMLYPFNPGP